MLYRSDENIVYPINLVDVRAFLSIQQDDQNIDTFLTDSIQLICARIEAIMPFWISERGISLTTASMPAIPIKGEIQHLVRVIATSPDGTKTDVTERCGILSTPNGSVVYPPCMKDTAVSVVFVPTAYVPDGVRLAILSGIRNLYINRNADPITEEVLTILEPYREVNINA